MCRPVNLDSRMRRLQWSNRADGQCGVDQWGGVQLLALRIRKRGLFRLETCRRAGIRPSAGSLRSNLDRVPFSCYSASRDIG